MVGKDDVFIIELPEKKHNDHDTRTTDSMTSLPFIISPEFLLLTVYITRINVM